MNEDKTRKNSGKRSATRYECGFFNEDGKEPSGPLPPAREGRGAVLFKKEKVDLFVPALLPGVVLVEADESDQEKKNKIIEKIIKLILVKEINKKPVFYLKPSGIFLNADQDLTSLNNGKWFEMEKPDYNDPTKTESMQSFVNKIAPYLSDDALHQFISILMKYEIRNQNPFRGTSLCKTMLYYELMRYHNGEAFNLQPLFRHLVEHDVRNNSRQADAKNDQSDFVSFIIFNVFNRHMDEQEAKQFCVLFNNFSEQYTADKLPPLTSSAVKAKNITGLKQACSLEKKNLMTKLFDGVKKKFVNVSDGHRNTF